jgi:hypothetical protein
MPKNEDDENDIFKVFVELKSDKLPDVETVKKTLAVSGYNYTMEEWQVRLSCYYAAKDLFMRPDHVVETVVQIISSLRSVADSEPEPEGATETKVSSKKKVRKTDIKDSIEMWWGPGMYSFTKDMRWGLQRTINVYGNHEQSHLKNFWSYLDIKCKASVFNEEEKMNFRTYAEKNKLFSEPLTEYRCKLLMSEPPERVGRKYFLSQMQFTPERVGRKYFLTKMLSDKVEKEE